MAPEWLAAGSRVGRAKRVPPTAHSWMTLVGLRTFPPRTPYSVLSHSVLSRARSPYPSYPVPFVPSEFRPDLKRHLTQLLTSMQRVDNLRP
jgi:hypothetical protein